MKSKIMIIFHEETEIDHDVKETLSADDVDLRYFIRNSDQNGSTKE